MTLTILADLHSHRKVVEEQRKVWLYELLYFLGINIDELDSLPGDLAVEVLLQNHITICDYPSMGALKVEYREGPGDPLQVVGEWAGPEYKMCRDPETNELYYEISIENWSIIDEQIDME